MMTATHRLLWTSAQVINLGEVDHEHVLVLADHKETVHSGFGPTFQIADVGQPLHVKSLENEHREAAQIDSGPVFPIVCVGNCWKRQAIRTSLSRLRDSSSFLPYNPLSPTIPVIQFKANNKVDLYILHVL